MTLIHRLTGTLTAVLRQVGSAERVAAAVEGGRRPEGRDLAVLGIDPADFARIAR